MNPRTATSRLIDAVTQNIIRTDSVPRSPQTRRSIQSPQPSAFDFFFGTWQVRHHRVQSRLTSCTDWDEFSGTCTVWPVLGGHGNIDDNLLQLPGQDYRALTLRSYDPASDLWAIWWLDARNPHQLDVPVEGRFADGTGTSFANAMLDDRPIVVRFSWLATQILTPRWEQAFSPDGGTSL